MSGLVVGSILCILGLLVFGFSFLLPLPIGGLILVWFGVGLGLATLFANLY